MLQDRVEWVQYKEKEILYCDYRNLNDTDLVNLIKFVH